jgi:hypothetical protein
MLVLNTGRLLKVCLVTLPSPLLSFKTYDALYFLQDGTSDNLSAANQVLIGWDHQKIPFFSEPSALHAAHVPSTTP